MTPTSKIPDSPEAPRSSSRRWFAGLAALGGIGFLAAQAPAHGWGRHGAIDPEERARRLEYRIGRMVADVGGTPQQKERLVAIATAAMADMRPLRQQAREARLRGIELLAATVIDRRALEQQRAIQIQSADARSRRMMQAMADAAEVLTPEQRVKMAARMKQRMERRFG